MVKRLFDVALTALALVACIPILLVAALGIRLSSPGPVLYRAVRAGRRGRLFTMYKLAQHYTPEQWETLDVPPGLTSPGALYSTTHGETWLSARDAERDYFEHLLPLKLALDRVYIRRASLGYDLRVIARTAAVVAGRALGRRHFADPPELNAARHLIATRPAPPSGAQGAQLAL